MIYTSANGHKGDAAWHANILRRIGGEHDFYVPADYMPCIAECLEETEIAVKDMATAPSEAVSSWIACGRFEKWGVRYNHQVDLVEYLRNWGNAVSLECGGPRVTFHDRKDMLCDFPAIQREIDAPEFDILIINCRPLSGQCPEFDEGEMDVLIGWLLKRGHRILCTNPTTISDAPRIDASICGIGNLSCRAKMVIAVSSGGAACIHNIWNAEVPKMLFLSPIVLNYGRHDIHHFGSCAEMTKSLHSEGYL